MPNISLNEEAFRNPGGAAPAVSRIQARKVKRMPDLKPWVKVQDALLSLLGKKRATFEQTQKGPPPLAPGDLVADAICQGKGHLGINEDPFGFDYKCLRCWVDLTTIGAYRISPDDRERILAGVLLVPDKPKYYTGMAPLWAEDSEKFVPAVRSQVVAVKEYLNWSR